jgi:hypothetical protein
MGRRYVLRKASQKQLYNLQVLACEETEHHQHQQMHLHLFVHLVMFHLKQNKKNIKEYNYDNLPRERRYPKRVSFLFSLSIYLLFIRLVHKREVRKFTKLIRRRDNCPFKQQWQLNDRKYVSREGKHRIKYIFKVQLLRVLTA